jgi:hypothetical protein
MQTENRINEIRVRLKQLKALWFSNIIIILLYFIIKFLYII